MVGYNTEAVCKITGLSKRQIDYWDTTHFIKPSIQEASGHGSVRLYSFTDLIEFRVAKALRGAGISLQKMRRSLNYLRKHKPEIEKPMTQQKFITDGESIFILTDKEDVALDTLKGGQLVLSVIALGKIVEELQGEVKNFSKEKRYTVSAKRQRYEVILHPDTEDGGYWVECPSLPGCASQGDTKEEALGMVKDAIVGHLEVLEQDARSKARKAQRVKVA